MIVKEAKTRRIGRTGAAMLLAVASMLAIAVPAPAISSVPDADRDRMSAPLLGLEIRQLFNADQDFLIRLADAKSDPAFLKGYSDTEADYERTSHLRNFTSPIIYERWSKRANVPMVVRQYVEFRHATDARIAEIVRTTGWPRRGAVGDIAAADFFFLFGHADGANAWRLAQLPLMEKVFREDHVNPRLFAHLVDRVRSMSDQPQLFGTIMGPKGPGIADVYWPVQGTAVEIDRRRLAIGLPSYENDLAAFRGGAEIGPYMSPIAKGQDLPISDVYAPARDFGTRSAEGL